MTSVLGSVKCLFARNFHKFIHLHLETQAFNVFVHFDLIWHWDSCIQSIENETVTVIIVKGYYKYHWFAALVIKVHIHINMYCKQYLTKVFVHSHNAVLTRIPMIYTVKIIIMLTLTEGAPSIWKHILTSSFKICCLRIFSLKHLISGVKYDKIVLSSDLQILKTGSSNLQS